MNNETVGEAVERIAKLKYGSTIYGIERVNAYIDGAYLGAKLMEERMYSEEEVFSIIDKAFHMYASSHRHDAKEWFEQFKKK